jgi:hypothetical protein
MSFKSYVELELDVNITHYQPFRSRWSDNPEFCEPDEYEEVEIEVSYNGVDITEELSKDVYDTLCEEACDWIKED